MPSSECTEIQDLTKEQNLKKKPLTHIDNQIFKTNKEK